MEADVFIRTEVGQASQVAAREVRMLGGGAGAPPETSGRCFGLGCRLRPLTGPISAEIKI
jgi:hypothetical protein